MHTMTQTRADWRIILGGLFFAVLALQGCTNEVIVKCGPNVPGGGGGIGVGGCNPQNVTTDTPIDPATTICKSSTGAPMTCPTNAFCSASSSPHVRCDPQSPGSNRSTPCRTIWKESSPGSLGGSCECSSVY